jgi:hypothetical protein
MSELVFIAITAMAAAFKVLAIIIGLVWGFRQLLSEHGAALNYRYTHTEIPYRPWRKLN